MPAELPCRLLRGRITAIRSSCKRVHAGSRQTRVITTADAGCPERQSLLYIAPVWPERSSSAAGVRTSDLISKLSQKWQVHFLSPCKPNQHTERLQQTGVEVHHCPANREQQFADVLQHVQPAVCMFDRFYAEEAFAAYVQRHMPSAMRCLDMQDFHSLRQGRMEMQQSGHSLAEVLEHRPCTESSTLLRELASVHRCDLTLVCSPVELHMLQATYGIAASKLSLAPFFVPPAPVAADLPGFAQRRHFVSIGNFKHPPNLDSVQWLAAELWDGIRQQLGQEVELHLFGAYATHTAQKLHDPAKKVFVKGHMPSLEGLQAHRLLLAPLRFGAGLKGKVVDAWSHGLPVVTTPIGCEGLGPLCVPQEHAAAEATAWGGCGWATSAADFVDAAVQLYNDEQEWTRCQQAGLDILAQHFDRETGLKLVSDAIEHKCGTLETERSRDFIGQMLWQQGNRATEYFARWIELKETYRVTPA